MSRATIKLRDQEHGECCVESPYAFNPNRIDAMAEQVAREAASASPGAVMVHVTVDVRVSVYGPRSKWMGKSPPIDPSITIEGMGLSVRTTNALTRNGVRTVGELMSKPDAILLGYRNLGRTSLREIKRWIAEYGTERPEANP